MKMVRCSEKSNSFWGKGKVVLFSELHLYLNNLKKERHEKLRGSIPRPRIKEIKGQVIIQIKFILPTADLLVEGWRIMIKNFAKCCLSVFLVNLAFSSSLTALKGVSFGTIVENSGIAEGGVATFFDPAEYWSQIGKFRYIPNYRQVVWRSALEYYESRGNKDALNPSDRNGQRSVGCFQFQDPTFRKYVEKYELLDLENLDAADWENWIWDCDLQIEIVNRMLNDSDVNFKNEFPDVVRNKIGLPPIN